LYNAVVAHCEEDTTLTALKRALPDVGGGMLEFALNMLAAAQFEAMSAHDDALQQMIDYAQTGQCRWRAILDSYGDTRQCSAAACAITAWIRRG
jgi:ATP-dependent DNA helicase RecQ